MCILQLLVTILDRGEADAYARRGDSVRPAVCCSMLLLLQVAPGPVLVQDIWGRGKRKAAVEVVAFWPGNTDKGTCYSRRLCERWKLPSNSEQLTLPVATEALLIVGSIFRSLEACLVTTAYQTAPAAFLALAKQLNQQPGVNVRKTVFASSRCTCS